uniref:Uncharacterized protein n=1 Tax=Timema monikensis TaxID=170555 RepID=A0A7R9DWT6_9NEOP|nr:unnamed protein product [Timema monikensis]
MPNSTLDSDQYISYDNHVFSVCGVKGGVFQNTLESLRASVTSTNTVHRSFITRLEARAAQAHRRSRERGLSQHGQQQASNSGSVECAFGNGVHLGFIVDDSERVNWGWLVQYIFLKLNVSTSVAIPQFMKKIQKSLFHSFSDVVFDCCAHAHIRGEWGGRRDCQKTLTMTLHTQEISSVTVSELQQLKFSQLSLHEKWSGRYSKRVKLLASLGPVLIQNSSRINYINLLTNKIDKYRHKDVDLKFLRVNRVLTSLQLTHFLCYGSLWGQIRLSRSLPWEADVEFCLLNEELSLHDEVFLARAFKKHKLDMKYNSAEGLYMITDPQFEGGNIQLIVFEEDTTTTLNAASLPPPNHFVNPYKLTASFNTLDLQINMLRRVGWKRRMLPPNCEEMTSLECFPPRLIARPLPLKEFGGYILPVPREGIEIQKYHYQQNSLTDQGQSANPSFDLNCLLANYATEAVCTLRGKYGSGSASAVSDNKSEANLEADLPQLCQITRVRQIWKRICLSCVR